MIGVVAHDAGGAEIISSYIRRQQLNCIFCLGGAAVEVVDRKIGEVKALPLESLIAQSDSLLCGTSSISDLEWSAIGKAKEAGKHCAVVLDHWVKYRERFVRYGEWHWPDEVWVGDENAARIAAETLPNIPQTLVPNAYLLDVADKVRAFSSSDHRLNRGLNILYVCEPISDDGTVPRGDECDMGFTEFDALSYFLSNLSAFGADVKRIVIRPHPKERLNKYHSVLKEFDLPLMWDNKNTLLDQIAESDIVAGCTTMAMVVGLVAGKRVVSCIPPGVKMAPLPQPEIASMSDLIAARDPAE